MKQKWWILLTLLLCGCGASSQPDQTGAVQNDRPRLSASMEETAENVAAVEKNENLEKNPSNSNQNPGEGQNWTVFAMDTVMQFDAYGVSAALQEKVKRRVEELEGDLRRGRDRGILLPSGVWCEFPDVCRPGQRSGGILVKMI